MKNIPEVPIAPELTEEEKQELDEILLNPPDKYTFRFDPEWRQTQEQIARLQDLGSKATSYILEKIHNAKNGREIFKLACVLELVSTEGQEVEIGKLLEQENIANDTDRSTKHRILSILNQVAIMANVPQLKKFAEMSLDTKYADSGRSQFNRGDIIDAVQTLLCLKSSLTDEDQKDKQEIDDAILYLDTILVENGYESLSVTELIYLERMAVRDRLEKEPMLYSTDKIFDDAEHVDEIYDPFPVDSFDTLDDDKDKPEEIKRAIEYLEQLAASFGRPPSKDGDYDFFAREVERNELFEYCKKIAEYLHDNEIPSLVIIDRSSRPVYIGVKEYWRFKYPDENPPNIYFMNPSGFKTHKEKNDYRIDNPSELRSEKEVLADFQDVYKKLMADKDKPVLVFDSCIHSGNTLVPVRRAMIKSGFKDLLIGSINPSDFGSSIKTDFYISEDRPAKGCYPFDRDRMIEKVLYSPHSVRTSNTNDMDHAIRLRREIKRIMEEKIKSFTPQAKPNDLQSP